MSGSEGWQNTVLEPGEFVARPVDSFGRWIKMPASRARARDLPRAVGNRKARRAEAARRRVER